MKVFFLWAIIQVSRIWKKSEKFTKLILGIYFLGTVGVMSPTPGVLTHFLFILWTSVSTSPLFPFSAYFFSTNQFHCRWSAFFVFPFLFTSVSLCIHLPWRLFLPLPQPSTSSSSFLLTSALHPSCFSSHSWPSDFHGDPSLSLSLPSTLLALLLPWWLLALPLSLAHSWPSDYLGDS